MLDIARQAIAAEVRAALARHDKSQRDLAAVIRIDQASTWARLRGKRSFRAEEIAVIAAWLDMPVSGLVPAVDPTEAVA